MMGPARLLLLVCLVCSLPRAKRAEESALLRGHGEGRGKATSARDEYAFAHHKVKRFRFWDGELVEVEESSRARRHTSAHCANPWKGGENHLSMVRRYDLRADKSKFVSDPSLEGTFRSRCIPVGASKAHAEATTTAFVDQCILEGECDETSAECRVHFGDCPIAAPKGGTHVRWVKLGSHVKQPSLLEAHSSVPKLGSTKRCLYAKSMPDSAEAGHHIEVPVTRPCPDINEKAGDEEEDMKELADEWLWMLKPRTGLVITAKHAKCLSLVPTKEGSKNSGELRLKTCHFMDTPIYQGFDLYKSTRAASDQDDPDEEKSCDAKLPDQTMELPLEELPEFIAEMASLEDEFAQSKNDVSKARHSVRHAISHWVGKLKSFIAGRKAHAKEKLGISNVENKLKIDKARKSVASYNKAAVKIGASSLGDIPSPEGALDDKINAGIDKGVEERVGSAVNKWEATLNPEIDVELGGSVVYGSAYGLPLNNDYYDLLATDNYRCARLPMQTHADKRYGLVAVDLPIDAKVGVDTDDDQNVNIGAHGKASASLCMIYNLCAKSFAIELSSSLLLAMMAGPKIGGAVSGGFGMGVSLTGELERAMDIPLWDGSRPSWVSSEFLLRDNGHYWFEFNARLEVPTEFTDKETGKDLLSIEVSGDLLINTAPRTYDDMISRYRHFGEGVLLWNGKDDPDETNVVAVLNAQSMRMESVSGETSSLCSEAANLDHDSCLELCQSICNRFNKECHFLSFYYDEAGSDIKCNLYKTANTVKAKKRTKEELAALGYKDPTKLLSYFRDPKLKKRKKIGEEQDTPHFNDGDAAASERNPQQAVTRYMGGAHKAEAKKSMLDALFTVSALGKVTLALDLSAQSFGMIDLSITVAAAVAIRAGRNIPNPGVYITLDLSAENKENPDMQKKAVLQLMETPSRVYNDVAEQVDAAKNHMEGENSESAKSVRLETIDTDALSRRTTSGKASATAQFFFRDLRNFGFRTKSLSRREPRRDKSSILKSTFLELKVVEGKFMVCFSEGETENPECASSVLQIMRIGGKFVVNVVKDFAGLVLMVVGTLVNGAVELSKEMYKAISKGVVAGVKVLGEVTDAAVDKVADVAGKAVTSVGNCCTFGVFDSTKNFGSCCGGPNLGSTMPGYIFDFAIKYSFDLALHEDDRFDWMRDVAENGPHEYSSLCLAPGTPLGGEDGEPCDTGSCNCKSGQICETKTLGGEFFCRDLPGGAVDSEGYLVLKVPRYTLNATGEMTRFSEDNDRLGPANWDAGTNCGSSDGGVIGLDVYTKLKEDYALALFGDPNRPSRRPLKDFEDGGELEWVAKINQVKLPISHQRNRFSSVCTGSEEGQGCSNPLFGKTLFCKDDELCEYGNIKNSCRSVPAFAREAGSVSHWRRHYPDGLGFV